MAVFQFDVVDSILICPIAVEDAPALSFVGLLGSTIPSSGNALIVNLCPRDYTFQLLYGLSIAFFSSFIVANFVWREYSLIKFERTVLNVVLHVAHFVISAVLMVCMVLLFNEMLHSDQYVRTYLDSVSFHFFVNSIIKMESKVKKIY